MMIGAGFWIICFLFVVKKGKKFLLESNFKTEVEFWEKLISQILPESTKRFFPK